MQISKLQVGTEYLASRNPQWRTRPYASINRVRVLSTTPYAFGKRLGVPGAFAESSRGDYVKVMLLNDETGEDYREMYVKAREIRGSWTTSISEREANLAAERDRGRADSARREAAREQAESLAGHAQDLGLKLTPYRDYYGGTDAPWVFRVTAADLKAWMEQTQGSSREGGDVK
jgi:hypothetical protein